MWGQIQSKALDLIQRAQNKALGIISFKLFMELFEPLYNQLKISSLKNNTILNNCLSLIANNLASRCF